MSLELNPTFSSRESATDKEPKKYMNGWSTEIEELIAGWCDKALCFTWMHDLAGRRMESRNRMFTIPVILLSTLTGTTNFGMGSLFGDDATLQRYAQMAVGGVSIIAGALTTLMNTLRYAQLSESHRVSNLLWGKFQRMTSTELKLHPNNRMDCLQFLKICRVELDRLIEQSPPLPQSVIDDFKREFEGNTTIKKPEIANGIEHTTPFKDDKTRLKQLAVEATMYMRYKKQLLKEIVMNDLSKTKSEIRNDMEREIDARITGAVAAQREEQQQRIMEMARAAAMEAARELMGTSGSQTLPSGGKANDGAKASDGATAPDVNVPVMEVSLAEEGGSTASTT
jgi:hypothetical protein